MKIKHVVNALFLLGVVAIHTGMTQVIAATAEMVTVERGKYLVKIAGCNDCHTAGYMMSEGKTPEDLWLTGDTFGWRGPWGTTYATNLRIRLQELTEDEWLSYAKSLKTRPPMPWFNLNQMEDGDLRAIYRFIRHLGSAGNPAPSYLPPDKEPAPPFALFPPPPPTK